MALTSYGLGAAYDMSKLSSRARGSLEVDERGFGGVLYEACGDGR
jgi:hypothetical protein